jgi:hypothetical protein
MDTYSSPGARIAEAMDLVEQAQALLSTGLQLVSDASEAPQQQEQQQQEQQSVEAKQAAGFGSKQPQALHMIRGHPGESLSHAAAMPAAAAAPSAAVASTASKALEVLQEAQQRREQVGWQACRLRGAALA